VKNYTTVYAVRHGETEWNVLGKQQGHLDSPLSENGRQQAHSLKRRLTSIHFSKIYCSSLGRAKETVEILYPDTIINILYRSELKERNLGILQGLTLNEFQKQYPVEWKKFRSGDPEYNFKNGESTAQRHTICTQFLQKTSYLHTGETILIITHGGILNCFYKKASDLPIYTKRTWPLYNAAVNILHIHKNNWEIKTWSDISHLEKGTVLDDN
jgi:probable phosphoglycerate mutase